MALQLRQNVESDSISIVHYDTTCAYNDPNNLTGFGSPNPAIVDFISATLEITEPGATVSLITTSIIFPTLPNIDGTGRKILASEIGLTEFVDGLWTFKYTATTASESFDVECKFLFDCGVQCCLDKRVARIGLDADYDQKTSELQFLLDTAHAAMCKEDYTKADSIINVLINECNCCC